MNYSHLSQSRSLYFLRRISRSANLFRINWISTKVTYSDVTTHDSLLKALGGCKVEIPLPHASCTLLPSVEISKDARKLIAKDISARLCFADILVKTKSKESRALVVYSILKEILRYGHGDLMESFKSPTEMQQQLLILHEEETDGKELEAFLSDKDMRGKLEIEFGEELEGATFTGKTDFIIRDKIFVTPQQDWKESLDKPREDVGKVRFLALIKNDLSNEILRSEAHYQLIAQLITALETNAHGHQCWGAITDGYTFCFYRVSRGIDSNHDYIVHKGMMVSLFLPGMLPGEHPVEALNYFFSSMYPEINKTVEEDYIVQSDKMSTKLIHFKKIDFEHSFKEFTQKELAAQIKDLKKKLTKFPAEEC